MGDGIDGVGRLVMRGKTCEVKAATPKGEAGFGGKKLPSRASPGGPNQSYIYRQYLHHHQQHQQQQNLYSHPAQNHMNHHMHPPYPYVDAMGYPMMTEDVPSSMLDAYASHYHHHHQGFHPAAANAYGHVAPFFYPTVSDTGIPSSHSAAYPGHQSQGSIPSSPPGPSPYIYMSSFDSNISGSPSHAPPMVVPDYYNHGSPTYGHPPALAYVPTVPMPPQAAGGTATSVMQPVAPGIPGRGMEGPNDHIE